MRRLARLDWGAVIVVALCLIAVVPWLTRPGLPAGTDAEIHVPRVAEFARVLADGVLYPRWAPDFYLGYGYPLFNFYAPLVYYLAQPLYLFVSAAGAVKALFVIGTLLAGLGMYAFAQQSLGRLAGVVAAAAFLYAPYLALIDPFVRVDLAEYFAIAWMPWVLWGFDRLLKEGHQADATMAALLLTALAMTHNVMLMLFVPLLAAYLLLWLCLRRERSTWARVIGAGILAVGLSAVFWLPALAEKQYIILDQVIGHDDFDFHRHFLTLGELLRPSSALDLGALNPPVAYTLGIVQWIGGLAGWLAGGLSGRRAGMGGAGNYRFSIVNFMGAVALTLGILALGISARVWEAIVPLRYVQFPWRLLGVIALPIAWLMGAGVAAVGARWRAWVAGGALALVLIGALPVLYPPPWTPLQANFSPYDMIQLELDGVALGTTANREYTPVWVKLPPHESGDVLASYEAGELVSRFDRKSLPQGASLRVVRSGTTRDTFEIISPQPFIARIRRFYFPGWRAWVDGKLTNVVPGEPHGFITVLLPAGKHTLELRFGSTPPRTVGMIISAISLLALAGWNARILRARKAWNACILRARKACNARILRARKVMIKSPARAHYDAPLHDMSLRGTFLLGGVVILFFLAKATVVDQQPNWFRRTFTGDEVAVAQYTLKRRFEGQISLLGYDLPQAMVAQDGELPLTLYWKATGPVPKNYSVFVHLVRPAVHTWGQDDRLNPGDVPATRWPVDRYVRDAHRLRVLPGTPSGEYQIEVGLYESDTGHRLFAFDGDGAPVGQGIILPQIVQVTRADVPFPAGDIEMQEHVGATFGNQVSLIGYDLNPTGDLWLPNFLHVTLLWQAERTNLADLEIAIRLQDETGVVHAQVGGRPVDAYYPTPQWLMGEVVRDQYSFWLAKDFPPGRYSVKVLVSEAQYKDLLFPVGREIDEEGWMFLAQVEVRKP